MKKNNIILIINFLIVLFTGFLTMFREQKDVSVLENRKLTKIPFFTLKSYMTNEFQSTLENSLSDQYIFSDYIKYNFNEFSHFLNFSNIPKNICSEKYVAIYGNETYKFYNFNCEDYIIMKNPEEINIEQIDSRISIYNKINDYIDTYYYFISMPKIYDFENNKYNFEIIKYVKNKLENFKDFQSFEFNNYEEYKQFFYKTDHHWNYEGSYKGYSDIISMILPNDKLIEPQKKVVFDKILFYGSRARISQIYDFVDDFIVYKFNYPKMKITNEITSAIYGEEEIYYNNNYPTEKTTNHYSFYGNDSGEVIFNTPNDKKDNILILGDSMSNAINKLIASHFNRTHVIDLRHYEKIFNQKFNIKQYIKENKIDKVLFIINFDYLNESKFNIDWEY